MSIIEKALEKIEKKPATDTTEGSAADGVSAEFSDTVQKVSRQDTPRAPVKTKPVPQEAPLDTIEPQLTDSEARKPSDRIIIQIPFDQLHASGMLTPAVPRSTVAEEYRTIKRPLLRNINNGASTSIAHPNLIMITSALQGDGKTFSSINLALSIAMEQDKTVLYVDADTAKASAGKLLGVPENAPGLIDVLENKGVSVGDVLLNTNMKKLSILPAGNVHSHSNELLASEAMQNLMLELSQRYSDRVIVFDSPPLLLTTEAGVLASFMGQIVFVVRADVTPQFAVVEALEHIGEDKMVGVMLNQARKSRFNLFGYGYGYGYGYGNGKGGRAEYHSTREVEEA